MLTKIKIKNYALINEMEVSFNKGFSCVTGETGAGKSIVLGALSLTLGERVDTSVLKDTTVKCVIETWFNIEKLNLNSFFDSNELDWEKETILRREILPSGKSRAFINDTPVSLALLKLLSSRLIDVHSQHQTLMLNSNSFQLELLDANANNIELLDSYKSIYIDYQDVVNQLSQLKNKEAKLKADSDYFQFQFNELDALNLENINEDELTEELDLLNNAEEIKSNLTQSIHLLDDENGIVSKLMLLENSLLKIANTSKKTEELRTRINSILIEIQDIQSDMEDMNDSVVFDQNRIEELTDKTNGLISLHEKHHTTSVEQLLDKKSTLEENLLLANNFDLEIEKLEENKDKLEIKLNSISAKITKSRKTIIPVIEKEIEGMLTQLSMENAALQIDLSETSDFTKTGKDSVSFLFRANKGGSFNSLAKVASGGELSRLMLSVKTNFASRKGLPTLIFDEIDTGVSGDIASKMGEMMRQIGGNSQVISITHLPQIAGKGNSHYKVYKEIEGASTVTKMTKLSSKERLVEIAKMLSGAKVTEAALENAKVLMLN